ncbi:MAG: glycosyltransferase family 4 protein, partial [Fusobacteriaceae bacterium]
INPGIVAIHDIQTKVHPEFFSKKFALWYNVLNRFNIRNAKKIITVSKFSKSEILKYYKVSENKIEVIYNGWQHMDRIEKDEIILEKLNVKKDEYILGVSSMNPNKNFKYILGLAKLHPEYKFVIVGKKNSEIFKDGSVEEMGNLTWAGYVSDEELKGLYSNAKAFVFPSFYEGFGIPPLEAIASGCKNIFISNTSCLPEVYYKEVLLINPLIPTKIKMHFNDTFTLHQEYSWQKSSKQLKRMLKNVFKINE